MDPTPRPAPAELGPIQMLEPVEFDFSAGRPFNPKLGKTELGPISMLPDVPFTLDQPAPIPELVLTLTLRNAATPAGTAVDLFEVWKSLSERERGLRGAGLNAGIVRDEPASDGTVIRLVLTALNPIGAAERLRELAASINGPEPSERGLLVPGRSFSDWSAAVQPAA